MADFDTTVQPGRLREAREYLGPLLTREVVAARLRCSPQLIAAIEDGTADPGPEMLAKLGALYQRPVSWFTGEFRFEPGPELIRMAETALTAGDREAVLDFAEFLACKAAVEAGPQPEGSTGG